VRSQTPNTESVSNVTVRLRAHGRARGHDEFMVALLLALSLIVLLATAVLVFTALPARGRDVPMVPGLAERVRRVLPEDEPSPAHGVLSSPERDRRAQQRFERAEQSVHGVLGRVTRAATISRHRGGPDA
jgi:hypothetical protein